MDAAFESKPGGRRMCLESGMDAVYTFGLKPGHRCDLLKGGSPLF